MRRCEAECYGIAEQMRSRIAELFGGGSVDGIILCPGILIGLHALFSTLGVRRLALGAEEYYGRTHFPQLTSEQFAADELVRCVRDWKPDAVFLSLVTWRGRVNPLAEIFRELRNTLREETPLLVADYSHGGAIGFPDMGELNADVVCGDPMKWVASPEEESRLAFLRIGNGALLETASRAFQPFFLATGGDQQDQFFARWVDPREIRAALAKLSGLDRAGLVSQHAKDLQFAVELGRILGLSVPAQSSSILWVDREGLLPDWLADSGLVWKPPGGGVRILCRADVKEAECCGAALG